MVSIVILGAHKKKGQGGHFVGLISRKTGHLAAIVFVDDMYLIHIDTYDKRSIGTGDSHGSARKYSINNWGQLLSASGGFLTQV